MSNIGIALAHELGTYLDDLIDDGSTQLNMPGTSGEVAGRLLDSNLVDGETNSNQFIALITDPSGKQVQVRVTCEELA
jgi:hypothetical protein